MEHVLLLAMFAGVTQALFPAAETKCNATQNSTMCSPAVGGSVHIQLMINASGYRLICKKKLPTEVLGVFTLKKGKVTVKGSYQNRTEFFINNGTLRISKVEKNDSGYYSVQVFDQNGQQQRDFGFTLDVKENFWLILIYVCSAVLPILVILCCVFWRVRRKKKSVKKAGVKDKG